MWKIAALCLSVVGCATSSRPIMAPDGGRALVVECNRGVAGCYDRAAQECPRGYDVLDKDATTRVWSYNGDVNSSENGTMLVRCRHTETPAAKPAAPIASRPRR